MTRYSITVSRFTRIGSRVARAAVVAASGLALASSASAQAFRSEALGHQGQVEIKIEASKPEIVRLLAGMMELRADVQLGLLAKHDGLPAQHINDARTIVWPEFREGLMAAGVADLDPLLLKLDAAADPEAITAAQAEIEGALLKGRSAMNPTSADVLLALHDLAKDAAANHINQSGPTAVHDYQDAWAMIMAARGELDLLTRDPDPTIAKYATETALALDDLIISLPDPNQSAAVDIDPALFNDLVARLEKMDQEA